MQYSRCIFSLLKIFNSTIYLFTPPFLLAGLRLYPLLYGSDEAVSSFFSMYFYAYPGLIDVTVLHLITCFHLISLFFILFLGVVMKIRNKKHNNENAQEIKIIQLAFAIIVAFFVLGVIAFIFSALGIDTSNLSHSPDCGAPYCV